MFRQLTGNNEPTRHARWLMSENVHFADVTTHTFTDISQDTMCSLLNYVQLSVKVHTYLSVEV